MHLGGQKHDLYGSLRRPLASGYQSSERVECGKSMGSSAGLSALGQKGYEDTREGYIGDREEYGPAVRRGNSDLQLLNISWEARRLNQMIDSWSKSPSFDCRSTGIAADLLRGALELQESMLMLGKLREASDYETRSKHWYYSTWKDEETGEMRIEPMGSTSTRYESGVYQGAQQAKRAPVNGSSAHRREELKNMIRASIQKQNVVSAAVDDEKASFYRPRYVPSRGEHADARGQQVHRAESSVAAAASQRKVKTPNLIARLMGLEKTPTEEEPRREVTTRSERKKNPAHPRHFLDIEMPKERKPPCPVVRAPELGRKTLQEIIEGIRLKGLLRGDHLGQSRGRSPPQLHTREWLPTDDESPPIVIIKPGSSANIEVEEALMGSFTELDRVYRPENGQFSRAVEEAARRSALPKRMESRAGRPMAARDKVEMLYKNKTSAFPHPKQMKEIGRMIKKHEETKKSAQEGAGLAGKSLRHAAASGSQNRAPLPTPVRRIDRRPGQVKNPVSTQAGSSKKVDHRPVRPATRRAMETRETKASNTRAIKELTAPSHVGSPDRTTENKEIIPAQEKVIPAISLSLPSHRAAKERASSTISKRDGSKDLGIHCEVMPKCGHGVGRSSLRSRGPKQGEDSPTVLPGNSTEELKALLLGSQSFLLHAGELFNVLHHHGCRRTESGEKTAAGGTKLLLDCSAELMASRSRRLQMRSLTHPALLSSMQPAGVSISLDQLVDGIGADLEKLRCYTSGAGAAKDSLYERLERDLTSGGVSAAGAWDWGWTQAFPLEESDRVACDVERHVLSLLVEEVAAELASSCRLPH